MQGQRRKIKHPLDAAKTGLLCYSGNREFNLPSFTLAAIVRKKNIARTSHQIVAVVGSFMLIMSACCDDKEPLWTWSCLTAHLVTHLLTLSEGLLYPSLGH